MYFWSMPITFIPDIRVSCIFLIDSFTKKESFITFPRSGCAKTVDSSVTAIQVNLCHKVFFLQNRGRKCCVKKLFWMSETISVHNTFSPGLSLEFFRHWTCNSMNNLLSYCELVDSKIWASDKDLPVQLKESLFRQFLFC